MRYIPQALLDTVKHLSKQEGKEDWEILDEIDEQINLTIDDYSRGYYDRLREEWGSAMDSKDTIQEVIYWLEDNVDK